MAWLSNTRDMVALGIAGAAVLACVGLSAALWWQGRGIAATEAENASLTRSVAALALQAEQSALAADVAAARAARAQQMSAEANAQIEAIRNLNLGDCADETIDPALADVLGRRDVPAAD
ncbi:MAG: hypothetical protein P1U53_17495 [Sulfitobacter sp.]|nr:hypothetical protein [Sulfitobacter sp.]